MANYLPLRSTLVALFLLIAVQLFGQRDIEPKLIFSDTANYQFSGEWQYLSTDIYLFNGEKFSNLINELDFAKKEPKGGFFRKKGLAEEYLEYLFITASLKNVKFFGNNDVTYPLYNFQISKDKDSKYRTYVSDNIDHIRIIDNLPLYSASDYIDAEIRVKAITNNDQDQILGLIASQLKNIAKIKTPTDAVLGIIGEFGNFIESNTRKKEYRFASTIRLFEQKNFDTRLHSVKIYALQTANSRDILVDTEPISLLLDTIDHSSLNRHLLKELINLSEYPFIVVANYKSLYKMEQVTGDEVNFANIEKRKLKIENDFRTGLINADTYRQEKDFIGFLTVFANLKNHLEVYSLNYKTGNTEAISVSLFRLLQFYRQLLKTNDEILFKYKGNSAFYSVFKKEYESILGYAALYLDDDHNLKNLKSLVQSLVYLESNPVPTKQPEIEAYVDALRFSDVFKPEHTSQSMEGQLIRSHLQRLEDNLYQLSFEKDVLALEKTPASPKTKDAAEPLRNKLRSTSCGICKEKGLAAIKAFAARMDEYNLTIARAKNDSLNRVLQPWFFTQLEKLRLTKKNLEIIYPETNELESYTYLNSKLIEAERDIRNLQDYSKIDLTGKDLSMVLTLNEKVVRLKAQVEETFGLVCGLKPDVCNQNLKPVTEVKPESDKPTSNLTELFQTADSVARQANIFIAIFDFQLKKAQQEKEISPERQEKVSSAERLLNQLKVAVNLYHESKQKGTSNPKLEKDINILLRDTSDALAELEREK